MPVYPAHSVGHIPELAARFARTAQCPADSVEKLQWLVFPIAEADSIPAEWRGKTLLELPRVMFGKLEAKTAARLAALKDAGFAGAVVNNPAQLRYTDGWTLYGGLGLNITNPMSAARYTSLGLQGMLLQPETALTAMQAVAPGVPTAALCYGHLPLMLTRACPLRNVHDCASCRSGGTLRDRKGRDFTVTCSAPGGAGIRTVYNPVPLYMGDRLREMPVDTAVAAFTTETPQRTLVPTGLAIELPDASCVALVYARSGLSIKHGLCMANGVGVIDSDYRGELRVPMVNLSDTAYTIQPGERVAQLCIAPVWQAGFAAAEELSDTDRGIGGFGSTGK